MDSGDGVALVDVDSGDGVALEGVGLALGLAVTDGDEVGLAVTGGDALLVTGTDGDGLRLDFTDENGDGFEGGDGVGCAGEGFNEGLLVLEWVVLELVVLVTYDHHQNHRHCHEVPLNYWNGDHRQYHHPWGAVCGRTALNQMVLNNVWTKNQYGILGNPTSQIWVVPMLV